MSETASTLPEINLGIVCKDCGLEWETTFRGKAAITYEITETPLGCDECEGERGGAFKQGFAGLGDLLK